MDACNLEETQKLFILYSACFSGYFPELGFSCNEKEFMVRGVIRRYKDVTGVNYTASHFRIEIKKEYVVCLPILYGAKFGILAKCSPSVS